VEQDDYLQALAGQPPTAGAAIATTAYQPEVEYLTQAVIAIDFNRIARPRRSERRGKKCGVRTPRATRAARPRARRAATRSSARSGDSGDDGQSAPCSATLTRTGVA